MTTRGAGWENEEGAVCIYTCAVNRGFEGGLMMHWAEGRGLRRKSPVHGFSMVEWEI